MRNNKARHRLKVAVLCIAVSLLSFFAGAKMNSGSFRAVNKGTNKEIAAVTEEQYNFERLKPILDVMKLIENKYVRKWSLKF